MSKKVWGNITWRLFHTMSLRMKDATPDQIYQAVMCIQIICKNLPCPLCSNEASTLLKKYNLNQIKTLEDFKQFVHNFHNKVNQRLKRPAVEYSELSALHTESLNQILNQFFAAYNKIQHNSNMMLYRFHRDIVIHKTRQYFLENTPLYTFQ